MGAPISEWVAATPHPFPGGEAEAVVANYFAVNGNLTTEASVIGWNKRQAIVTLSILDLFGCVCCSSARMVMR